MIQHWHGLILKLPILKGGAPETFVYAASQAERTNQAAGDFIIEGCNLDDNNYIKVFSSGAVYVINADNPSVTITLDGIHNCSFNVVMYDSTATPDYVYRLYVKATAPTPTPVAPTAKESESEPKPVIYPEDEFGAYYLNEAGEKEYAWFTTYEICTRFMGNADACESYLR